MIISGPLKQFASNIVFNLPRIIEERRRVGGGYMSKLGSPSGYSQRIDPDLHPTVSHIRMFDKYLRQCGWFLIIYQISATNKPAHSERVNVLWGIKVMLPNQPATHFSEKEESS